MSGGVERYDVTVTPHSRMERTYGGPCPRCGGNNTARTYYSDVTIHGQHRAIILETCSKCDREPLAHNETGTNRGRIR